MININMIFMMIGLLVLLMIIKMVFPKVYSCSQCHDHVKQHNVYYHDHKVYCLSCSYILYNSLQGKKTKEQWMTKEVDGISIGNTKGIKKDDDAQ